MQIPTSLVKNFPKKLIHGGGGRIKNGTSLFASHLQMTHELSLKVYKVKACLHRLKCSVNSKYKTQVLVSLDRISFQFLYVIGRHISLVRLWHNLLCGQRVQI